MKKIALLSGIAVMATAGAIYATSELSAPKAPARVPVQTGIDAPTFYGAMEESDDWYSDGQYTKKAGVYSFTLDPAGSFDTKSSTSAFSMVTHGGFYADGYFYYLKGEITTAKYTMNLYKMNVETWKSYNVKGYYNADTKGIAYDMTYDYTTSTAYASAPVYSGESSSFSGYGLRKIDLATGEFTHVADLDRQFTAIACDGNGQLWGIARGQYYPYPTSLYKINKINGQTTFVGDLGLNLKSSVSSATFDIRTGKLYWTARTFNYNEYYEETYSSDLYEVDTTTGQATVARAYDAEQLFASIFMIDNHPQAPEAPTDLHFKYDEGSITTGSVVCTLPTLNYSQKNLSGKLGVEVLLDGEVIATGSSLNPGDVYTSTKLTIPDGTHTIKAYAISAEGRKSLDVAMQMHSGFDVPGSVEDLTVTTTKRGDVATITWKAPSKGKNNGVVDASQITYTVVRRPDNVVIANGTKETTITDAPDRKMGITQYEVTPYLNGEKGVVANTELILAGTAHPITYLETFDNYTSFLSMTTIDVDGDGSDEYGNKWLYYAAQREAIWWISEVDRRPCNDWIVTPTLDLSPNYVYRFSFFTHTYSSGELPTMSFDVKTGDEATVEALNNRILYRELTLTKTGETLQTLFVPREGDCRIGILARNQARDHVPLDNVRVAVYGPVGIPEVPTVTTAKNDGKVDFTITLPTKSVDGNTLQTLSSVIVYGDKNRVAAQVMNPKPGATVKVTDSEPLSGVNNYIIVAENASGEGLEAYATVDVLPSAPLSVENVTVASVGSDAVISWKYPESMKGANGETLRASDIRYNVYRVVSNKERYEVAMGVESTSVTDENVDMKFGGQLQMKVTYAVEAVTDGGKATEVKGESIVGRTIDLPYNQTFSNWDNMWYGNGWNRSWNYDPRVTEGGQDDNSFVTFFSNSTPHFVSPRLNLNSLLKPRVTFWLYKTSQTRYNGAQVQVGVIRVDENGIEQSIEVAPNSTFKTACAEGEDGWYECTADLSKFGDYKRASVVLIGYTTGGNAHVDNITVSGDRATNDMRLRGISGPARAIAGRDNIYTVDVYNNGLNLASDFKVEFYVEDQLIDTKTASLESAQSIDLTFAYKPSVNHAEEYVQVKARVISTEADDNADNNQQDMRSQVYLPDVPYVTTLRYQNDDTAVRLEWDDATEYPHNIAVLDDVESYMNFDVIGGGVWKMVDGDGAPTLGGVATSFGTYDWEHAGEPQSFIVFNPTRVGIGGLAKAYSGDRCFVSFVAGSGRNDDWMISPLLLGGAQTISFWARAMNPSYLNERLEVCYSTTSNDVEEMEMQSMIRVNSSEWRKYTVKLPAGARYFAFHCVSAEQFGLMIDNIEYVPAQPAVDLYGYNVYRDDECIAVEHGENFFEDTTGEPLRSYRYNVTVVYDNGESAYSNTVQTGLGAIDSVVAGNGDIKIVAVANGVEINGANGEMVTIHTVDGALVYSFRGTGNDRMALAKGIYMVKAGNVTEKILVK